MTALAWIGGAGIAAWLGLSLWFCWPMMQAVRRSRARQHEIEQSSAQRHRRYRLKVRT